DIGLERDAFLYVTDFAEQPEGEDEAEFEAAPADRGNGHGRHEERAQEARPTPSSGDTEPGVPASAAQEQVEPAPAAHRAPQDVTDDGNSNQSRDEGRRFGRHRRGRRGRGFPESKYEGRGQRQEQPPQRGPERAQPRNFGPPSGYQPIILPGESISKY